MTGHAPIELRINDDTNLIECDWGVIHHPRPRFDTDPIEVGHLCLVAHSLVDIEGAARHGEQRPSRDIDGALIRISLDGDRRFLHATAHDRQWTWELFETRWWDDHGRLSTSPIWIGRWPD